MNKIAYKLLHLLLLGCAMLPFRMLYWLADITFLLIFYIFRYRRKVVINNLRESFPDKTLDELKSIERQFYRNLADYFFETIKLLHISDRQMERRMTFENVELIDKFVAQGRSVAVYFSHCGNWEWAPSVTLHAKDKKRIVFGQVYRPLRNKAMDCLMLKIRSRFGSVSFPKRTVFRDIIRQCRDSGHPAVVGFMSDQHPSHGDLIHVVEFLNHPTAFITGTETLARKLDMGVIYWDVDKPSRGHYHIKCCMMTEDIRSTKPFEITDQYISLLQSTIRRRPDLWLWTHKRWKTPVTFTDNESPRHF